VAISSGRAAGWWCSSTDEGPLCPPPLARSRRAPAEGPGSKLAANVARDRRTDALLSDLGWTVLRFWEHEDPEAVVDRICTELGR
jgi:hypothetical protein